MFVTVNHSLWSNVFCTHNTNHIKCYYSSVGARQPDVAWSVQRLSYGLENWRIVVWFPGRARDFSLLRYLPDRLKGPFSILFNEHRVLSRGETDGSFVFCAESKDDCVYTCTPLCVFLAHAETTLRYLYTVLKSDSSAQGVTTLMKPNIWCGPHSRFSHPFVSTVNASSKCKYIRNFVYILHYSQNIDIFLGRGGLQYILCTAGEIDKIKAHLRV
jgi:hypothetical protein